MNINLVDLLKQKVSAIVLEGETEYLSEKSQALSNFFPILLSIFKSKPQLIGNLQSQLNPRLSDVFSTNPGLKQEFLEQVSGTVPTGAIESTLNHSIAPTLNFLETEAGSSEPSAIVHLIETHWPAVSSALPHWAPALLSALGVGLASDHSLHQAPETHVVVEEKKKSNFLLPLIGFIILAGLLALMFRACSDKRETEPASGVPAQTVTSEPAKLQLNTGSTGDLTTCQLYSGNAGYIDILQKEIKQIFNHNIGCGVETNAGYHTEFIDQDAIPSVLKLVKGVPNASLIWMGDQLSIQTANPADAEQLATKIKPLVRNMTVITQAAAATASSTAVDTDTAVNTGNTNAEKALAAINPDQIRALDIATALNMQIINFDTASTAIPDANKSILDQAAALIKRASQVHLTVKGHTDAVGNAQSNKALSQKRAQAVVDYLVKQGVDPAQLQAVGYGSEQPVADNATPEGQFKNRRIEFEVLNTETGTVREVDEDGVKQQ